jgi:uncharacterized protein with HEPN domain
VSPRSWRIRLQDMLKAIDEVAALVSHPDFESFRKDRAAILASLTCIHILSEASNHIPQEIKQKYPELPWSQIRGMRNRIAHEYFEIDESIVWTTCKIDFPKLRPLLVKVLDSSRE